MVRRRLESYSKPELEVMLLRLNRRARYVRFLIEVIDKGDN